MRWFLAFAATLHALFMFGELYPWGSPYILGMVGDKLLGGAPLVDPQLHLVNTVLHNAGIYNGIVAGGLFWAASGKASLDVARVMLIGAVVAGVFGGMTIDWPVYFQAIVGLIGLVLLQKQAQRARL